MSWYQVVRGDGWLRIASKVGVPLKALLAANGATTSTKLQPGSSVCVPAGGAPVPTPTPGCLTYQVVRGDSWSKIASKYTLTLRALLELNGATAETVLLPGMKVCVAGVQTPPTTLPVPSTTTVPPSCAVSYQVVRGDGWWLIATRSKVPLDALLAANGATAATPLFPGSTLCLPASATPPAPPSASTTTSTVAPVPPVGPIVFPVQGPCWFGDTWLAPRSGGRRHEGVDIIAAPARYVYAAVSGTLTRRVLDRPGSLSGNAWWLTAGDGSGTYFFYAHLSAFAPGLEPGAKVAAGQVIGWVGATGNASGPHLHFEVHPAGGAPVNPTSIVAAVDGCKTSVVPPQPSGAAPPSSPTPPSTTVATTSA